jgi:hypothetical protein
MTELTVNCERLIETYDANILDSIPKYLQDEFYNQASKIREDCVKSRNILSKLIINHYKQHEKPRPDFIGGPTNLTVHYSSRYNKLIYIFGEHHLDTVECDMVGSTLVKDPNIMNIEHFLSKMFETTDAFIDLFLEVSAYKQKSAGYENDTNPIGPGSRFYYLFETFKDCIQKRTRHDSKCGLGRVHYFDIRRIHLTDYHEVVLYVSGIMRQINIYNKYTHKNEQIHSMRESVEDPHFKSIFTFLLEQDQKTITDFFIKICFENSYNKKELDRVEEPMKTLISEFIIKEITNKVERYMIVLKDPVKLRLGAGLYSMPEILLKGKLIEDIHFVSAYTHISNFLTYILTNIPDVYLLSRLFKIFDIHNIDADKEAYKDAITGDQPKTPTNVIIYVGDEHAQRYRRFLKSEGVDFDCIGRVGTSKPEIIIDPNTGKKKSEKIYTCINMEGIVQPFFSENSKNPDAYKSSIFDDEDYDESLLDEYYASTTKEDMDFDIDLEQELVKLKISKKK